MIRKALDHLPGYEFGDDGSVWSEWAGAGYGGGTRRTGVWRKLKLTRANNGYVMLSLRDRAIGVHRLILEAFCGPCPAGMEACHNNGDRSDNRIDNLRWDTRKANHQDKHRHGTAQVGERGPSAKLTNADAEEIRRLRRRGTLQRVLAKRFGVAQATISDVVRCRTFKPDAIKRIEREQGGDAA